MRVKCIFSIGDPPDMRRRNEAATRLQSHLEVLERFLCSSIPEASKKSRPCPGSGHVGRGSFVGSADSEVLGWGFSCKGCVGSVVVIEVLEGLDHLGDFVDSHWQVGAGI